jgi:hypothetical protein
MVGSKLLQAIALGALCLVGGTNTACAMQQQVEGQRDLPTKPVVESSTVVDTTAAGVLCPVCALIQWQLACPVAGTNTVQVEGQTGLPTKPVVAPSTVVDTMARKAMPSITKKQVLERLDALQAQLNQKKTALESVGEKLLQKSRNEILTREEGFLSVKIQQALCVVSACITAVSSCIMAYAFCFQNGPKEPVGTFEHIKAFLVDVSKVVLGTTSLLTLTKFLLKGLVFIGVPVPFMAAGVAMVDAAV